jgi:membrane protein required for colicin V production
MGALSFSFVDVLVVAVIVISAWYAAWRGFVQESLSIFAWAAAAFAALYFGPAVVPLISGIVTGWGAILAAYAGIFLIVVIPLSFISYRWSENVRRSPVQGLDRAFGFAFGIVRGLVIVGIAYLVFSMLVPIPRQPSWMTQARLLPLIQKSSEVILAVIPDQHFETAERKPTHVSEHATIRPRPKPVAARHAPIRDAETAHAAKRPKKTYGAKDRQALDKLIEASENHKP